MKRTILALATVLMFAAAPLHSMERKALLGRDTQSRTILNTPLSQIHQGPLTYQSFPAQPLTDILKQRHPDHEPLLAPETRAENITLIRSIGSRNTATKLFALASLLFSANAAKDIVSLTLWGLQPLSAVTPLIPPSHLAPLQPCYQVCYLEGCCSLDCDPGSDCITDCSGPWVCTPDAPSPRLTNLGITNLSTCGINVLGALVTGFLAFRSSFKSVDAERELAALVTKLDEMTNGQPIPPLDPSPALIQEVLDKVVAQGMEQDDQIKLEQKRQDLIDLIKSTGSNDAKVTLSLLLAAIFGLNLTKDIIIGRIWGQDTTYPLTPLLVHNKSTPLMPCKQVCWGTGCCNLLFCPVTETCMPVCEPQCVDIEQTPNALGYTSLGTSIASAVGLCGSLLSAYYYKTQKDSTEKELNTLVEQLDQLIESSKEV